MALHPQTIPIASPEPAEGCGACARPQRACAHRASAADAPPPRLSGDMVRIERLLARLAPQMEEVFGHPVSPGVWLDSLSLSPGQAHLALAPNLACHATVVAELAFDAMRQLLPDTDLYIGALHD